MYLLKDQARFNPTTFSLNSLQWSGAISQEEDARFFFGREKIRNVIIDSLQSWRLTLLYGASGVGKSSVLYAGVVPKLRQMAEQSQWVYASEKRRNSWVIMFIFWRDDLVNGTRENYS